jgi:hypothetical protein
MHFVSNENSLFRSTRRWPQIFYKQVRVSSETIIFIKTYIKKNFSSLNKTCPPFCNPSDFYMDTLGVDVNDSINSTADIHVCFKFVFSFQEIHNLLMFKKRTAIEELLRNFRPKSLQQRASSQN